MDLLQNAIQYPIVLIVMTRLKYQDNVIHVIMAGELLRMV